jgi:hypothetical protein
MRYQISAAVVILLALANPAEAEMSTLHCKGVDYVYEAGIGKGPARRQPAERTLLLDLQAMTAGLADGERVFETKLVQRHGTYQGFFPGEKRVYETAVLGDEIEIDPAGRWLELRYRLVDQRHFLAFTGECLR